MPHQLPPRPKLYKGPSFSYLEEVEREQPVKVVQHTQRRMGKLITCDAFRCRDREETGFGS